MERGQFPYQAKAATGNIKDVFNCKPSLCKVTGKNLTK